jgi:hypothetical protein
VADRIMKLWTGLGLAAIAGAALAAPAEACAPEAHSAKLILAAGSAGEGGEGGEGGEAGAADSALSDVEYLAALGYVEGHMTVGIELYKQGHKNAAVHMKHPADELYADLQPAFEARKVKGFGVELDAVSTAVESGKPPAEVEALLAALKAAIAASRGEEPSRKELMAAAAAMVRTAGDEYGIGVVDGKIVNDKEYQDAWGFVTIARALLAEGKADAPETEHAAFDAAIAAIDALAPAWPDIVGAKPPAFKGADISVAAAKIELAAYELK